jgi:hypothetical protein
VGRFDWVGGVVNARREKGVLRAFLRFFHEWGEME